MDLKISVVITVYNRREFINDAIKSVINQTVNLSSYEIIIISNFPINIESSKDERKITVVVMDGTVGQFLYKGICVAKYDIITFLEDDDLFLPDKFKHILEIFSNNQNLSYYHNNFHFVNKQNKLINYYRLNESESKLKSNFKLFTNTKDLRYLKKILKVSGDFNLSCITIKKSLLEKYLGLLKEIKSNPDAFFFWTSLISESELFIEGTCLTNYRIHKANVSSQKDPKAKANEMRKESYTYDIILNYIKHNNIRFYSYQSVINTMYLFKYEFEMIALMFDNYKRLDLIRSAIKIIKLGSKITNTLKKRILIFSLFGLISQSLLIRLYYQINSLLNER